MAQITNKLVHFNNKTDFDSRIGDIRDDSIVFVKDATIIQTHQQPYYCGSGPVALKSELATVATTGSYNDLIDKPENSNNYIIDIANLSNSSESEIIDTAIGGWDNLRTAINNNIPVYATITIASIKSLCSVDIIIDDNSVILKAFIPQTISFDYELCTYIITNTSGTLSVVVTNETFYDTLGLTATAEELNYCDGVTSNIQTQLNGKLSLNGGGEITSPVDKILLPWNDSNASLYTVLGWENPSGKKVGLSMNYSSDLLQYLGFYKDTGTGPELIGQITFDTNPEIIIKSQPVAFKSDLSKYLPLTGGTITGETKWDLSNEDFTAGAHLFRDSNGNTCFSLGSSEGTNSTAGVDAVFIADHNDRLSIISGSYGTLKFDDHKLLFDNATVLTEDNYSNYITSGDNVYYIDCSSFDSSSSDASAISTALGGFQNFLDAVKAGKIICDRTNNFEEVTPNGTNIVYSITSVLADPTWIFTLTGAISGGWVILEISFDRLFTTASIKKTLIERGGISASNTSSKSFLVGVDKQSDSAKSYSNVNVYMQSGQLYATQMNATRGFYETSDARLKNFKDDIKALDVVSEIPTKYFTWKKEEIAENIDPKLHIGTSAQEIQKIYPDLVSENEEGILSVDYARLSIIAIAAIKELKAEINELKSKLN